MDQQASTQPYSTLLSTVSELRVDLERAVARVKTLESENISLQESSKRILNELTETRTKYNEAKDNYIATAHEKLEAERQNEEFVERVKVQLVEKTKEFELLREKLVPQDIDFLRIRVQEELEIPHRIKFQSMESEMNQHRDKYFAQRRDFDRIKTEYDVFVESQQRQVSAILDEREAVVTALRQEISKLRDREYAPEKDEQLRSLKYELHEANHLLEQSRAESKVLRQERDSTIVLFEEYRSKEEASSLKLKARLAAVETDRLALEQRISTVTTDNAQKETSLRMLKQTVDNLTEELNHARKQSHDSEARLLRALEDHSKTVQDLRNAHEEDKKLLLEDIERQAHAITENEEALRKLQRETSDMQARAESIQAELRRSSQQQLHEHIKKIVSLEAQCIKEQNNLKIAELDHAKATEKLTIQLSAMKSDMDQLLRQKSIMHDKIRGLESRGSSDERHIEKLNAQLSSQSKSFQTLMNDAKRTASQLQSQLLSANEVERDLRAHIVSLTETIERDAAGHIGALSALKLEHGNKILALESEFKDKVESLRRDASRALVAEKKKSSAYKEKALEAHERSKAISSAALAAVATYGEDDRTLMMRA